jgi:V/A-type H+-transporting ATPase subunit I
MAVLTMKKINICAMKKDRKKVLEKLQSMGVVEVKTDGEEDEVFKKINTTSQKSKYEKRVQNTDEALDIIQQYAPAKTSLFSSLEGKKSVDDDKLEQIIENRGKYNLLVKHIKEQNKEIANCNAGISKCELAIEGLKPWLNMDIPINTSGTKHTDVIMGSMAPGLTEEMIENMITAREPELQQYQVNVISTDKDQTCICVICHKDITSKLEENLRAEGFTRMSYFSKRTPEGKIEKYKREIEEYQKHIEDIKTDIINKADKREDLQLLSDYYRIRADKYNVLGNLLQSHSTFLITGYVLERDEEKVIKELNEDFSLMVETEAVPDDEEAPVQLSNPKPFSAAEGVLASYGLPAKGEMDPTTPMSIFYVFLFGLMLSDAAYGLIIFLACFIVLKKFPKMADSMQKSLTLFMYCGLSTLIWGVLFGGYFGDLVTVVSKTFFHHEVVIKPLWFAPLDDPMKMLVFSLLFGLIHLFGGLAMKGYMCLKKKDFVGFFADVIPWYMLIAGLIMMLMPTELFASIAQVTFNFSPALKNTSYIITIVGAVVIILMSGRSHKNPVLRLALGLYDIYNLTGWLSDILSYSRLLALGLATGVIAQVVNQMGSMMGDGIVGIIVFIIVFLVGHTFNLAINMLGAYVHTCRLQYVEFFGKFYEGGGVQFAPFRENTKYVDIESQE